MTQTERNQNILAALEKFAAKNAVSPAAARRGLIQTGIYTQKGKIRVEYGGEPKGGDA